MFTNETVLITLSKCYRPVHSMLLLLFGCSVMSDSLQLCGQQRTSLPCPSLSCRVCSNSCPLSQWCHPTIASSVTLISSCLQSFPASGSFQWVDFSHLVSKVLELQLQHQSFQWISGLISFRIDWFDLFCSPRTLKSLLQHHSSKPSILWHSAFFHGPFLTSIHDYWKNHIWTFVGRVISAL